MSFYKVSSLCLGLLVSYAVPASQFSEPTQAEIELLRGTHSQFDGLMLDGDSAHKATQHHLQGLSLTPSEVRHPGVVFSREDAKIFRESNKVADKVAEQEKSAPEWIRDVEPFLTEAQTIKDNSANAVEARIKAAFPGTQNGNLDVTRGNGASTNTGLLMDNEDLYYFISTSLKDTEIIDIMVAAKRTGATVVLRGMLPNTSSLSATSYFLMDMLKEAKLHTDPPKVIMDPRLFTIYSIEMAPAMVYVRERTEVVAHGVTSPEWFINEGRMKSGYNDLGTVAAVTDIVEIDILELLQKRYEEIDWDKQRKNAINKFFAKQTFEPMPVPEEDKHYEIDPRIVFTSDVYSGGRLLAQKGDVVNPLANFEGHNRSLFIVDPRDPRQRSLVKERLYSDAVGMPTVVVSHLDAEKKFDGIAELQNEFKHQIFMLQHSYIDRFKIDKLPVRVDIIGGKGIWMREYGTETLNEIHDRHLKE